MLGSVAMSFLLVLQSPPPGHGASFRGLGDLPGGRTWSEATGISDDGAVVIGKSSSARCDEEGFRWTETGGMTPLETGKIELDRSEPRALTADGRVVVGLAVTSNGTMRAAAWTGGSRRDLPDLPGGDTAGGALAIDATGKRIVGWGASASGLEAMLWDGGEAKSIGDLEGGVYHSGAATISADGKTIAGTGATATGREVFVWTEADGFTPLGDLAGGELSSEPFAMTPDAAVIVGKGSSASGVDAFRWTDDDGMQDLGDLEGGEQESVALAVSRDGKVVVGYGTTAKGVEAFVWDAAHGMRKLQDVLATAGVKEVERWTLEQAVGVSGDGKLIVGVGTDPEGNRQGWIARFE